MKVIIHISDMHFGKIIEGSTDSLLLAFKLIRPDLVIISGDLTERAKPAQFKSAQKFLQDIKRAGFSYFVVPGNHDIEPFYKPFDRVFNPFKNYKKYITNIIEPVYSDGELAVASIDTTRPMNAKSGSIRPVQIQKVQEWFSKIPARVMKIIVSHHPFDLPMSARAKNIARKARGSIGLLSKYNIDLYLSGHSHLSSVVTTKERYNELGFNAVALQAGTLSTRQRGEVQSFNVITANKPKLSIDTYLWDPKEKLFSKKSSSNFTLADNSWKKL